MRRPELDNILNTMLESRPEVSDLLFTVDKPLQVESFGELKPVEFDPAIPRLTPYQTEMIALNLIGLALGFGTLGILILVKGEHAGESWIIGVLGIVVGSLFLLFAFYFCKHTGGGGSKRSASWHPISPASSLEPNSWSTAE